MNTANGGWSFIGGGFGNTVSNGLSTISGGYDNTVSGARASIGGGQLNTASGNFSTVPGGRSNVAGGKYSFVAGRSGDDLGNDNSFVWGGASGARTSAGVDTFNIWSAGGLYLNGALHSLSDRNMKEAFSFISAREVLDKVVEMPVTTWRFKSEENSVRHIGPMAQDFMAAFGYGVDDTHITVTDEAGVALAAIQGLHSMLAGQAEINTALRWHNEQLHQRNNALEARLRRIEKAILRNPERAPTASD